MTNGTTDAFTVLADELGRIGRRLDGMGTELLALRGVTEAAGPAGPASAGLAKTGAATTDAAAIKAAAGAAGIEHPGAEPRDAEHSKTEHGKTEHGKTERGETEPSGAESGGAGPSATAPGSEATGSPAVGTGQAPVLPAPGIPVPGTPGTGTPVAGGPPAAGGPLPGPPAAGGPVAGATGQGAPWPPAPVWSAPGGPTGAPGARPAGYPPAGPYGAVPAWPAGYQPGPAPRGGYPAGYPARPAGGPVYPPGPPPPAGPVTPPAPRRSSALTGARLLAWTGGAVTLLGVVLLLALAASRGWLNAPTGLTLAGVLGAVLVGLALRLHRKESARTGAFALAATGFATLYLTVAAATALYDYLPAAIAIPLSLVIAGAGLGVADRWRSPLLAGGVTVGGALLAPALADGWLLVALALALQLAALPVVLRRGWSVLLLLAAAGPALYGAWLLADETRVVVVVVLAVVTLAVGLASAFLARTTADGARATVVVAAALPALAGAGGLREQRGWILALGVAVVLGAMTFLPDRPRAVRVAAGVTAVVALLAATVFGFEGSWITVAVLGEALAAAGVATALRSRFAVIVGLVLGSFGFLAAIADDAPLRALLRFDTAPYLLDGIAQIAGLVTGVAVSLLVLAVATVLLLATGRLGWTRPDSASAALWVPLGLVGLYGAASLVMAVAMLVASTQAGFTAGHAVITVSWAVAALVLLARGLSRPALRIAGLVLVAAAVAKLLLFDLVALDGLARVVAFLGAGLVLLAAGTRYARLVAEAEAGVTTSEKAAAGQVPPTG